MKGFIIVLTVLVAVFSSAAPSHAQTEITLEIPVYSTLAEGCLRNSEQGEFYLLELVRGDYVEIRMVSQGVTDSGFTPYVRLRDRNSWNRNSILAHAQEILSQPASFRFRANRTGRYWVEATTTQRREGWSALSEITQRPINGCYRLEWRRLEENPEDEAERLDFSVRRVRLTITDVITRRPEEPSDELLLVYTVYSGDTIVSETWTAVDVGNGDRFTNFEPIEIFVSSRERVHVEIKLFEIDGQGYTGANAEAGSNCLGAIIVAGIEVAARVEASTGEEPDPLANCGQALNDLVTEFEREPDEFSNSLHMILDPDIDLVTALREDGETVEDINPYSSYRFYYEMERNFHLRNVLETYASYDIEYRIDVDFAKSTSSLRSN